MHPLCIHPTYFIVGNLLKLLTKLRDGGMDTQQIGDSINAIMYRIRPYEVTTGDGAVNVYSRVQMMLSKARQQAEKEVKAELAKHGATADEVRALLAKHPWLGNTLYRAPHVASCTAADVTATAGRWLDRIKRVRTLVHA